jgi:hypothetical protein
VRHRKVRLRLQLLQARYRNKLSVRMRTALALPFEALKLSAMALSQMTANDFAIALDRGIARSRPVLIEAKAVEPPPE